MNELTPKEEISRRIDGLRTRLGEEGLDGALLVQAVDVFYFSGTRQNGVLWVPVEGNPVLLLRKSFSRGRSESGIEDIRPFPSGKDLRGVIGRVDRIGLTLDVLPVQYLEFYRTLFPDSLFSDISMNCREIRSVKSGWELAQIRTCGRMLAEVFGKIPELIAPGMRELDLAAEFEYLLRRAGIGGFLRIRGFNQELTGIATSGENAAEPGCFDGPVTGMGFWTAAPYGTTQDRIKEDDPVFVDYAGFYNGYLADMTRIFCIGTLDSELERAYLLSCNIQNWIAENARPGTICADLFSEAVRMAEDSGLGEHFMGHNGEPARFVGHGVGLELDELPILAPKFRNTLQAGQTIAIEPKFVFPGKGVVGIENTFEITDEGCRNLTPLPDGIVFL